MLLSLLSNTKFKLIGIACVVVLGALLTAYHYSVVNGLKDDLSDLNETHYNVLQENQQLLTYNKHLLNVNNETVQSYAKLQNRMIELEKAKSQYQIREAQIREESKRKDFQITKYKGRQAVVFAKPGLVERMEQRAYNKFRESFLQNEDNQ